MSAVVESLRAISAGCDLSADQAYDAVEAIMEGQTPDALIAALLTAWRVKGETPAELIGAVRAVRARMMPWSGPQSRVIDTCGTGVDGAGTLNISTAAAIIVAACGVPVAKHGNRAATSSSGSAEVLCELGVAYDAEPSVAARCLAELGITFLFAPRFHPALRFAAAARRLLPFRTLFNLIGPLANPAAPAFQLLGVAGDRPAQLVADALADLGVERAAVVTGGDGLDEVTLEGPTHVRWVESGSVQMDLWEPASFGLRASRTDALQVSGPAESAARLKSLLQGERGPARDVVLANAAAALLVAGQTDSLPAGVEQAASAVDRGAAAQLLERWSVFSRDRELD
jgi:anthranilate phosphoribosyltransferase